MKKIALIIISFFIFNIVPKALDIDYTHNITNHLIDAEIEIAGGLRIKELIVIEGSIPTFSRTINYKNIKKDWDKKTINFKESAIYNGQSLENIKVAVLKVDGEIDFDSFPEKIDYLKEFDHLKNQDSFYTLVNNDLGKTINVQHNFEDRYAIYIEYLVSNVVVVHEDIYEINYTFKKININSSSTNLRVIIPYASSSEDYNLWLHAPNTTVLKELVTNNDEKVGFLAEFKNLKSEVNFRMSLPKDQVSIDIYLKHSNVKGLNKIIEAEANKINKLNISDKALTIIKYIFITFSVIYALASVTLIKYKNNLIFISYLSLGLILILFNYLFSYHIILIYLVILIPIIIKLINKNPK